MRRLTRQSPLFVLLALALMVWLQVSAFQVDERLEENGVELVFDDDCLVEEVALELRAPRQPRCEAVDAVAPAPVHREREARPPSRG